MKVVLEGKKLYSISDYEIKNPENVEHLDVSNNFLKFGKDFFKFKNLKTLIIDRNSFSSISDFPKITTLKTLSANSNNFLVLEPLAVDLSQKFPNLCHLSFLKNPLNPFFEGDERKYKDYRRCLLDVLPNLKNIDGVEVNEKDFKTEEYVFEEKKESKPIKNEEDEDNEIVYQGKVEYNEKYKYKNPSKNIKTKSEGNRFLKNEQL